MNATQTLRDLGVLRNRIGDEGLTAVIEYLPSQYTKRMLGSKDARAKYIATILADPQRPFVWEYFRPGTIPLAGERAYYDEVCLIGSTSYQTSSPHLWVETKGTVPIRARPPCIFCLLHFLWDSFRENPLH